MPLPPPSHPLRPRHLYHRRRRNRGAALAGDTMESGRKVYHDDQEPKLLQRSKVEPAEPEHDLDQVLDEDLDLELDED